VKSTRSASLFLIYLGHICLLFVASSSETRLDIYYFYIEFVIIIIALIIIPFLLLDSIHNAFVNFLQGRNKQNGQIAAVKVMDLILVRQLLCE
jgi:hypothetical protein